MQVAATWTRRPLETDQCCKRAWLVVLLRSGRQTVPDHFGQRGLVRQRILACRHVLSPLGVRFKWLALVHEFV